MYGVTSLPSTGTGAGLVVASQAGGDMAMMILMTIIAFWTILMCVRMVPRLIPKEEV